MRRSLLAVFLTCAFNASVPRARAAGPVSTISESDRLVDRALDFREAGNDREALPLLERAAALDPSPRKRAQLALGRQAMGAWVEAERGLVSVLASSRDSSDEWVTQNRATLEGALVTVRRQLGWLEV